MLQGLAITVGVLVILGGAVGIIRFMAYLANADMWWWFWSAMIFGFWALMTFCCCVDNDDGYD
jgi:hypothetical protein